VDCEPPDYPRVLAKSLPTAHFEFTRINIELTIVRKKIEEILEKSRSVPILCQCWRQLHACQSPNVCG
jgi:hypothetical protein